MFLYLDLVLSSSYGASFSFIPYCDVIRQAYSVSKNMKPSSRENSWFTLQKYKDKVKQKEAIKKLHLLFDKNTTYASYNRPVYTKVQKKQIIFDALEDIDVVGCMTKINTYMQEFKTGHG